MKQLTFIDTAGIRIKIDRMSERLNILIVEDSPDDCEIVVRHLKKSAMTFDYERVESEAGFISALEKTTWHAIICDYTLPQLNAPEVLKIAKSRWPEIPFIVLSGSIGEERAVETMRAGANDYIMKDNLTRLVPVLQREIRDAAIVVDRRLMEQALRKSEENLRQSQKLESIGQMAGGIAHDFNNLLATILIQSEMLLSSADKKLSAEQLADQMHKGVEQIRKSSERATSLTRKLLAFSRKQIILPVVVNINERISDMQEMLFRVVEKNISFHLHLDQSVKNIKIDPGHLELILLNLVINSRDALPNGGNISIGSKNRTIDELTAQENNIEPGLYVCLTVSDDGTGMTDDVKKNIFEPFFTTKPIGVGTGLGLSTIYGIVLQNHGIITVESTVGKGTEFAICFPSTDEAVQPAAAAAKTNEEYHGTEKILVVEDENDLRALLEETLIEFGYTVLTAANGSEALAKLTPDVCLIVTDVVMPTMGGAELATKALRINPNLKVIFQSGYTKNTLDQAGLPMEKIFFLAKPYKINALLGEIRKAVKSS